MMMESRETNTSLSLSLSLSERSHKGALFEKTILLAFSLSLSSDDDGCARQKKGKKRQKGTHHARCVFLFWRRSETRRARAQKERATPNRRIITTTRVQYTSFLETSRQRQLSSPTQFIGDAKTGEKCTPHNTSNTKTTTTTTKLLVRTTESERERERERKTL
jgi:hypothetical protein